MNGSISNATPSQVEVLSRGEKGILRHHLFLRRIYLMPSLSWNEVRDRAIKFAREWAGTKSESAEKQTFWNEFFEVFGIRRRSVATFEEPVRNIKGKYSFIDLFWPGIVLVEHKSSGQDLGRAQSQAFRYIQDLAREDRHTEIPRYVIVSDFARFALHDLEPEDQKELPLFDQWRVRTDQFELSEIHHHVREFAFLKGEKPVRLDPEDPANEKAYQIMANLHDTLERGGFIGHELERFLVRVLFCLFAEDTGIFEPSAFQNLLDQRTREDGSDLGAQLNRLFEVLNTSEDKRQKTLDEDLAAFPYVNGALFAERLGFADFNRDMRNALVACCRFQWARISPAVFGSLFQGIMDDKERRQQGAHYTSERDIMKVVRSLFLDELRAEFDTLKADLSTRQKARLEEFHKKLRKLSFLDPACGCGNFLVLTYRELRRLELDVLRVLHRGEDGQQQVLDVRELCWVDVDQLYGIELFEWPVRIAEVALWLMDHQMNVAVAEAFGQSFRRLPLKNTPHIIQGNALRLDWNAVLPKEQCNYILGNPPFVGKHLMSAEQSADMDAVCGTLDGSGFLDYVTGWYMKAATYCSESKISTGFVSTNSITQGEQAGILWNALFQKHHVKIHFAHRTFAWESEARGKAHVHVVIVGFGTFDRADKHIVDYDADPEQPTVISAKNISPYLVDGPDLALPIRREPICKVPEIINGNKPADGGFLIIEEEDRIAFLRDNPGAVEYVKPFLSAEQYLNGENRWVLWLVDAPPNVIRENPGIHQRVEAVREFRLNSRKESTRRRADRPALFDQLRQPTHEYILIPRHSSENRRYIPFGYFSPEMIIGDSCTAIPNAKPYHFGVISSAMHMAWVRQVCGRLKSDYRYSNKLVYNNFPWPTEVDTKRRTAVETAAQAVLDVRSRFLPPKGTSTLADLYDPLSMPPALAQAHTYLDRAVDRCYRSESFGSDRERVEHLFALYERLTKPLLPMSVRQKRSR